MTLALAGIRKFRTRTATFVSLLIAVALMVLEFVIVGAAYRAAPNDPSSGLTKDLVTWMLTFPGLIDAVLAIAFGFGSLIALIYVAVAAGSEWSWGTLKVAVARGESRRTYTLATYASLSVILGIGLVITFVAGIAAAVAGGAACRAADRHGGRPHARRRSRQVDPRVDRAGGSGLGRLCRLDGGEEPDGRRGNRDRTLHRHDDRQPGAARSGGEQVPALQHVQRRHRDWQRNRAATWACRSWTPTWRWP